MASSPWLRQQYSQPIYGTLYGMPSRNYKDFTWCPSDANGMPVFDPYELLRPAGADMLGEAVLLGQEPDEMVIAEGGAAATAYACLQFESLSPQARDQIRRALQRYCELDTLAIVMVVQGWQQELSNDHANGLA